MKKFILGLLVGALSMISITVLATSLNIIPNPYPVTVDGQKVSVEGYNINDSTYLKLTDFKQAGLDVNYNKAKKQIEITSVQVQQEQQISGGGTTMNQEVSNQTTPLVPETKEFEEATKVFNITLTGTDVEPKK